MNLQQALVRVQSAYPRIYLACHTRHQNARTTPDKLSPRDATLIAHLDEAKPLSQATLARHVSVAKSTLSEALSWLEEMGYVARTTKGRSVLLVRTAAGTRAMSRGSVLESGLLRQLLRTLSGPEREVAVEGIELLAMAAERRK